MAVGKVTIDVVANTAKLVAGMNKAESKMKSSVSSMKKVAIGFASGQLASSINDTLNSIDKLAKTSSKLGIGTDKLIGLQHAAEQSGVSVNTLNMALQRSTRRISEASKGTGEAVGALNELGISAEKLNQMSPDEQMNKIADAMKGVTSQSDRVRLSMKLFDSEGVALVNMLQNGSGALKDYQRDAESLGMTLSTTMAQSIERANDAMDRASKVGRGFWNAVTVALAPALETIANSFVDASKGGDTFTETLAWMKDAVFTVASGMDVFVKSIIVSYKGWISIIYALKGAIVSTFGGTADEIQKANDDFRSSTERSHFAIGELNKALEGTSYFQQQLKINMDKTSESTEEQNEGLKEGVSFWKEWGTASVEAINKAGNVATQAKTLVNGINSSISSGMTSAFRQAMDGALKFGDVMKNMLKDILAQIFKIIVAQQVAGLVTGSIVPSAKGNAIQGGSVKPFAKGGIVSSPTYFPMSGNNTGLMGEAGAEAIVPLKRTSGGDLGIQASPVNVTVVNNSNSNVSTRDDGEGNLQIIIDAISSSITRGTGTIGDALESRYGLSKA